MRRGMAVFQARVARMRRYTSRSSVIAPQTGKRMVAR
jgi:hypothetical protein